MEKIWSAGVYYYGAGELAKNTFKVSVQFSEVIDPTIMRNALDVTQKRYPYFSIRMVRTPAEILLDENPLPWVLKEEEDPISVGGAESNFHLIAFRYHKNWLYIDGFHGMTDGCGLMNMLRTLSYYYCRDAYDETLPAGDVWLAEDPVLPEEIEDPYQKFPPQPAGRETPYKVKTTDYMNLSEENHYERTTPHVFRLEIPQKELMRYCGENDGSPATAIALFIARAIKKVHPNSDKTIGCGMATDLRKALGTPRSHQSTLAFPTLDFTEQIANSSLERQGTAFRGQVLLKCDPDTLMDSIYASQTLYGYISTLPTYEARRQTMQHIVRTKFKGPTASISYVGRSNFGASEKYIRQLFFEVPGSGIIMELTSLNDIFDLTLIQDWNERTYFEAFCNELEACGIPCTLKSEGPLTLTQMTGL